MDTFKKTNIIFPAHLCCTAFMVLLFTIYPLYMSNGYYGIDAVKNRLLLILCIGGLGLIVLSAIIQCIFIRLPLQVKIKPSATDICVLIYSVLVLISSLFAFQRDTAWHGETGWYIGGIIILLINGLYFAISRFYRGSRLIIPIMLISSFLVFLLGVLNRFSIWPFSIPGSYMNFDFISTLGSIGWYNGYLSVIATVGVSMFVLGQGLKPVERKLCGLYTFVVFMTCLSQGGDTIFLYFLALFLGLLSISTIYRDGLKRWLEMVMLWALAGQVLHVLRAVDGEWFNYDSNNLLNQFNHKFTTLWIFIIALIFYYLLGKHEVPDKAVNLIRRLPLALFIGIIIYFLAAVIYTNFLAIEAPEKIVGGETSVIEFIKQILYIGEHWGSDRGASIKAGLRIYSSMPWYRKLFGVGPDCFSIYANQDIYTSAYIRSVFGDALLGNAHCELLTMLINLGLFGCAAYYGIFASFLYRTLKLWKEDTRLIWIAMSVICYLSYNLLNYIQILNYPFMFVLLAIGEVYLKQAQISVSK